jgi:hypothetical protein
MKCLIDDASINILMTCGRSSFSAAVGTRIAINNIRPTHLTPSTQAATMMEFRWVILLAMWTLLIGPVIDLTQGNSSSSAARAKTANVKAKNVR